MKLSSRMCLIRLRALVSFLTLLEGMNYSDKCKTSILNAKLRTSFYHHRAMQHNCSVKRTFSHLHCKWLRIYYRSCGISWTHDIHWTYLENRFWSNLKTGAVIFFFPVYSNDNWLIAFLRSRCGWTLQGELRHAETRCVNVTQEAFIPNSSSSLSSHSLS